MVQEIGGAEGPYDGLFDPCATQIPGVLLLPGDLPVHEFYVPQGMGDSKRTPKGGREEQALQSAACSVGGPEKNVTPANRSAALSCLALGRSQRRELSGGEGMRGGALHAERSQFVEERAGALHSIFW